MTKAIAANTTHQRPFGFFDRIARKLVTRRLAELRNGRLVLEDAEGGWRGGSNSGSEELCATVRVNCPGFFRSALWGGKISVAQSYFRGDWDCDDLTSLVRIFVRNLRGGDRLERGLVRVANFARRLQHRLRVNSPSGSRRNIASHYDLGNDFFRLWLDDTLAYSSGIFPTPSASLHQASQEKFDRVCRRLQLQPSHHLLEIGSGWGGFALHAAQHYGCRVTTTTISAEQHQAASERIQEAALADRVQVLRQDYRELTGKYDRLASIEMIEAVGHRYLDAYFRQCGQLLRPDGSLLLQAIVMPEREHPRYLRSVDFIQQHVFPGGCLPSLAAILESVGRTTDLRLVHVEDFAPHYAHTLRHWRSAFEARLDDVRRLGYPEAFIRLWNFYLCYCEAVFEERHAGLLQIQFDKPACNRQDWTREKSAALPARPEFCGNSLPRPSHSAYCRTGGGA